MSGNPPTSASFEYLPYANNSNNHNTAASYHDQSAAEAAATAEQISQFTRGRVEPWEVSYFNGGYDPNTGGNGFDEIPVKTRETVDQVAFRPDTQNADRSQYYHVASNDGGKKKKKIDHNRYATKKTIGQGLFNIGLLTANIAQLKFVLQTEEHQFYTALVSMLTISIILQVCVALLLITLGCLNVNDENDANAIMLLDDLCIMTITVITVLNLVVNGFGLSVESGYAAGPPTTTPQPPTNES